MNYYFLNFTIDGKMKGNQDYIKKCHFKIPGNLLYWEEPRFISNVHFKKIDFEPYLFDIELHAKSKLLDFMFSSGPASLMPVMSNNLKNIISKYREEGMQYFKMVVIKQGTEFDYWILNMYVINQEYIDFTKSMVTVQVKKPGGGTQRVVVEIGSLVEFEELKDYHREKMELVTITKLVLTAVDKQDFFAISGVEGGVKYIVSEKLKQEIEAAGCMGIEFQPTDLSFDEWTTPGGERERVYGKT